MAWHDLNWEPVAFAEIEPFPCAVLAHHYPDVPNLGDVTKITEEQIKSLGEIDLVVFGSPCTDLSIAGKRAGFKDADGNDTRSGLFTTAIRIIRWARKNNGCRFALWENVPGAFSSNKGADFARVVSEMAGLDDVAAPKNGWGTEGAAVGDNGMLEWACLDAQWSGLAQRRKRVFALVDFGDWASRPPILLERHSLRGDTPPSRETGQGVTYDVAPCLTSSGRGVERAGDTRGQDPVVAVALRGRNGGATAELGDDVGFALRASGGGGDKPHVLCFGGNNTSGPVEVSSTLNAHGVRLDFESELFIAQQDSYHNLPGPDVSGCLNSSMGNGKNGQDTGLLVPVPYHSTGTGYWQEGFGTLRARAQDSHENLIAFSCKDSGADAGAISPTLRSMNSVNSNQNAGGQVAIALQTDVTPKASVELAFTLKLPSKTGGGQPAAVMAPDMVVRRLTARECERLMGFPDDFTLISVRGKPAADGPRYKALGNSMAVSVMAYIGRQIIRCL